MDAPPDSVNFSAPGVVGAELNIKTSLEKVPATSLDVACFATVEEARTWLTRR